MKHLSILGCCALIVALSACSSKEPKLRDLYDPNAGPEEFAVSPNKPIQMPTDFASLPTPTPGQGNLVDPTPKADAIAALGGTGQSVVAKNAIGSGDQALYDYATRFGFDPNIRTLLSTEDEKFRNTSARFSRIKLFRVDRYNQAYRYQTLDAFQEVQRWRLMGVQTPTMPSN